MYDGKFSLDLMKSCDVFSKVYDWNKGSDIDSNEQWTPRWRMNKQEKFSLLQNFHHQFQH